MKTRTDIEIEIQHLVEKYGYTPSGCDKPTIVATGTTKIFDLVKDYLISLSTIK